MLIVEMQKENHKMSRFHIKRSLVIALRIAMFAS